MNTTNKTATSFLAQRVLGAKPSATKEMTRLANQLMQEGRDVIGLSQREPDFPTPGHVREAGKAAIDRNESRYTEVAGTLALGEAVADAILIHSKQKTPDEVLAFVAAWPGRVPLVLVPTAYPQLTEADISALGKVAIVIYGNHAIRAAAGAMRSVFAQIRKDDGIRAVDGLLPAVKHIIALQGDESMRGIEAKFLR